MLNKSIMKEAHKLTKQIIKEYGDVDYKVQLGLCISYLLEEQNNNIIAVNDTEKPTTKNTIVNKSFEVNSLVNTFEVLVDDTREKQFNKDIKSLTKKMDKINGILKVELINSTIMGNTYKITANINLQIPDYKLVAVNRLNIDKYIYSQIDNTVKIPDDIKTLYTCQHCNTNRKRKTYYVFYNEIENNFKVVGSSCCKLYFGIDIENILNKYSKVLTTLDCYIDNTIKDDIVSTVGTVERIVAYDLYNDTKYKSYQSYKEDLFECVKLFNNSYKYDAIVEYYNNNAKEIHTKAIDTMQYILDMENKNNNEYINNLKDLFSSQIMDKKFIKYILYCTKLVQIDKSKKKIKPAVKPSGYIGQIKDRLDLTLTVTNIIELDNYYSNDTTYMYLFTDKENNVFKWVTSAIKLDKDKTYKIKGTVKQHTEYKGIKQTVLTRCKIEK